jgi:hypothetical protein
LKEGQTFRIAAGGITLWVSQLVHLQSAALFASFDI